MATRKLIIAALCCGLAILLAGGLWLVATGNCDNDATVPLLDPGQSATVGGLDVTVLGGALDGAQLVLSVQAAAPAGAETVTDFASGWRVLDPSGQTLQTASGAPVSAANGPPCADTTLDPRTTVMCHMLFAVEDGADSAVGFTTVYERDGESGAWLLP